MSMIPNDLTDDDLLRMKGLSQAKIDFWNDAQDILYSFSPMTIKILTEIYGMTIEEAAKSLADGVKRDMVFKFEFLTKKESEI